MADGGGGHWTEKPFLLLPSLRRVTMGLHLLAAGETNQQTPMWTTRDWAGVPLPLPSPLTSVGQHKSFMAFPLLIFIQKFLRFRAHFTSWVQWTCEHSGG